MKNKLSAACKLITFILTVFSFSGCMKDKITKTYQIRTPIYEVLSEFRKTITSGPAVPLKSTGKISVIGKYIFLSEPYKGIHVIDNSNPASPKNVSFINIPGNEDLAIKGNTLYADAYGDLVTFDITDPAHVVAKNFASNVFPDHSNYYYTGIPVNGSINPDSINVIVGWSTRDTTVDYDPGNVYPVYYASSCANCSSIAASMAPAAHSVGTNGSTARFSIINNYLYTVGNSSLTSFDISSAFTPAYASNVQIDWQVETIYPLKNRLFVGTNSGMYMYDVEQTPQKPVLLGEFVHLRSCDPVIADDDYAYVTLNDGSACQGFYNELQIVDIRDMTNPVLVTTYTLTHPEGLSKDGNNLFICDGKDGLKVFNVAGPQHPQLIADLKDATVSDVVTQNGLAIVLGNDGIYQYDYSDLTNIHLISKL